MHESRPEQQRGREQWTVLSGTSTIGHGLRVSTRSATRPGAVDCTVWNEHHGTRLACRRPGPGAHRDIERGKVPSAARVACIARSASRVSTRTERSQGSMHREVSMHESRPEQNSNEKLFGTHHGRGTDCRICIDYTSIYYCCKSFPVRTASRCHGG